MTLFQLDPSSLYHHHQISVFIFHNRVWLTLCSIFFFLFYSFPLVNLHIGYHKLLQFNHFSIFFMYDILMAFRYTEECILFFFLFYRLCNALVNIIFFNTFLMTKGFNKISISSHISHHYSHPIFNLMISLYHLASLSISFFFLHTKNKIHIIVRIL